MIGIYNRLISLLAISGALALAAMVFAIVLDVLLRNIGMRPFQATSALIEYGMLYATMAGAPWLVRQHGHVAVTSFVDALPETLRAGIGRITLGISIAMLAVLAWRAGAIGWEKFTSGANDIRSIAIPSWILYAMLMVGFGLMATEFLRLLIKGELRLGAQAQH